MRRRREGGRLGGREREFEARRGNEEGSVSTGGVTE